MGDELLKKEKVSLLPPAQLIQLTTEDTETRSQVVSVSESRMDTKIEYRLHTLEGSNYTIWKQHTKNVLEARNLLNVVLSTESTDEAKERQAHALLTSALNADNQMKVINCGTANKIWSRLEAIYENKSSFEKENLLNKLHSYKIKSASNISQAISEMETIAAKLGLLGEMVSDDSLISAILRALPSSFKTFVTIWKGTAKGERTIDNLLTRLMAEIEDNKVPEEKALFGMKKRNFRNGPQGYKNSNRFNKEETKKVDSRNQNTSKNSEFTCHHCKKPGHYKKDCWQLQKANQGSTSNGQQRFNRNQRNYENKEDNRRAMTANQGTISTWIADSGASVHITSEFDWMTDYEEFDTPVNIGLGDQSSMKAYGTGNIETDKGVLTQVHYVPEASNNLFSESKAALKGVINQTDHRKKTFFDCDDGSIVFEAYLYNGLYVANFEIQPTEEKGAKAATFNEWHRRLAHVNQNTIRRMINTKAVNGLEIITEDKDECVSCALGKCKHTSHPGRSTAKVSKPGISLHFDTIGPIKESLGEAQYALLCKDEHSAYRIIKFVDSQMKSKNVSQLLN